MEGDDGAAGKRLDDDELELRGWPARHGRANRSRTSPPPSSAPRQALPASASGGGEGGEGGEGGGGERSEEHHV